MAEKVWKTKNESKKQKTVTNMVNINPMISIITLNINGPNKTMKRHRSSEQNKNNTQPHVVYKKSTYV